MHLWRCGMRYEATQRVRLGSRRNLALVLIVASITSALLDEIARMAWSLVPLGDGYYRVDGAVYATYVVATGDVADAEEDDVLCIFSRRAVATPAARRWLAEGFYARASGSENRASSPG